MMSDAAALTRNNPDLFLAALAQVEGQATVAA